MDGHLITIEGIEGAGKSTLMRALAERLGARGREVVLVREPGGTAVGEGIRGILLDARAGALTPRAELLLFCASRAQLVAEVVEPALGRGAVVLCDRFIDSSVAYQGAGRGLDPRLIDALNDIATAGRRPDLTLLIDLPTDVGLERARARRGEAVDDRFEGETLAFHQRVRAAFLDLAGAEPGRFAVLDGTLPPASLLEAAWAPVLALGGP